MQQHLKKWPIRQMRHQFLRIDLNAYHPLVITTFKQYLLVFLCSPMFLLSDIILIYSQYCQQIELQQRTMDPYLYNTDNLKIKYEEFLIFFLMSSQVIMSSSINFLFQSIFFINQFSLSNQCDSNVISILKCPSIFGKTDLSFPQLFHKF